MINSINVGVKSPVWGTGAEDGVGEKDGEGVGEAFGVGEGVVVCPEPEASKAGASPAWTTKLLVRLLVIPDASFQRTVILWKPWESPSAGLKLHDPSDPILMSWVIGFSDSILTVIVSPLGPSPKNSG